MCVQPICIIDTVLNIINIYIYFFFQKRFGKIIGFQ